MKKKILVTGSGGFIFSNFIRKVLKENNEYNIASIDKVTTSGVLNTIYSNKGHTFYIGDVIDSHFINVIFEIEKPDIVIHGAAESFVDYSIKDASKFITTNALGTQVMVDAAIKWGVKRFIYISTDECYGQLKSEDEPSWDENSKLNPRNPYSASKASGELLVKAANETHGLQYNITRSCNNYGPRQPRRNLIPVIISNILEGLDVPIYGQGIQVRDWIHVQDNCDAILHILKHAPPNETYNISARQEYTNIEIFHEICNVLEQDHNIKGHHLLKFVEDRKGHDFRYSITNDKLLKLGWKPKWNFKNGIRMTSSWYLNNRWFVKK